MSGYCEDCGNTLCVCSEMTTGQWRPIETAPKDGTEVLAWREDSGAFIARYTCMEAFMTSSELVGYDDDTIFQSDWFYADFVQGDRLEGNLMPTHWMPLPEPPKPSEGQG